MKPFQFLLAASVVTAAVFASPFASAHAHLKSSDPQAGASLSSAPKQIALTFNEKVEEAFSSITLAGGDGKAVTVGRVKVDSANPAILRLEVPALGAGVYKVKWAVAGHDGHRRNGDFTFSVK
jgi:copper resistance protein C